MSVNVGELIHDVTIQQLEESTASSGFPKEGWTDLCQAWMSKRALYSTETFKAGQASAPAKLVWMLLYRTDVDPDAVDVPKRRRLLYRGRTYDITAAETIGSQDAIVLTTLANG